MLIKLVAAPLESAAAPRSAENIERVAACPTGPRRIRRRCAGGDKGSLVSNRAMAIHAINFYGRARLPKNLSSAVVIRGEVTIIALHAFFKMDVGQVNGFR